MSIKVAITFRVVEHYRAPIFEKLSNLNGLKVTVFHGSDIPNTKLTNTKRWGELQHRKLFTLSANVKTSGRVVPIIFWPTIYFELLFFNPDVILAEGGSNVVNNLIIYSYAKTFRKAIIWWTLGELPGRTFNGVGRIYRKIVFSMERSSTVLLGYSSSAMIYFDKMGYNKEKCFFAVNSVDTDKVFIEIEKSKRDVIELKKKLGLTREKIILFVGALTKEKKVRRLLFSFRKIRAAFPNSYLIIVGDGPEKNSLLETASNLGITRNMTFSGYIIDNISVYFEIADVFVLPGLGGRAFSEAMAHGLPVICCEGDGTERDFVKDGVTGYHIKSKKEVKIIEEIATVVTKLLKSDRDLTRMSRSAKDLISKEYNIRAHIKKLEQVIESAYKFVNHSNVKKLI